MSSPSLAVLVVDRDPQISQPITDLLRALGHTATALPTIEQGLRFLDEVRFDVLIVSIHLDASVADISALQMVKAKHPLMKFIAICASDEAVRFPLEGLDSLLHKPFTLEQLEASIRS